MPSVISVKRTVFPDSVAPLLSTTLATKLKLPVETVALDGALVESAITTLAKFPFTKTKLDKVATVKRLLEKQKYFFMCLLYLTS